MERNSEAKKIIKSMLRKNPKDRIELSEIFHSKWLKKFQYYNNEAASSIMTVKMKLDENSFNTEKNKASMDKSSKKTQFSEEKAQKEEECKTSNLMETKFINIDNLEISTKFKRQNSSFLNSLHLPTYMENYQVI